MTVSKVAVLGAGNGGCATAADLAVRGFETRLYSRSDRTLEPIRRRGGIELVEQGQETFVRPHLVTSALDEAVAGADLIVAAVPAVAHGFLARSLAPLLGEDPIVHLNPGQTGGSLHFVRELRRAGCERPVRCCETVTLTCICRMAGPARVEVYRRTTNLLCAAFPGELAPDVLPQVAAAFPNVVAAENVMETGLSNINAVMHPAGMVANAGWIEQHTGELLFYGQAVSPAVARLMEAVDRERLAIVGALDLPQRAFVEIFHAAGLTSEAALRSGSVFRAIRESGPNRTIAAPTSHDHRYLHEDVAYGLVPMAELGRLLGVETPAMDALVTLASEINRRDYRRDGLTLERMGLRDAAAADLWDILAHGFR